MAQFHHFTEEEKAELLSNPYTARVSDCTVIFTLEFKRFVLENIDKPGMTARNVIKLAGYRDSLFPAYTCRFIVKRIRAEANSEQGLQEPKIPVRHPVKKKHTYSEIKELQDRVKLLEQQIEFLKKSQHLKQQDPMKPQNNTS